MQKESRLAVNGGGLQVNAVCYDPHCMGFGWAGEKRVSWSY